MRQLILSLLIGMFIVGCGPTKQNEKEAKLEFEVVEVPMVVDNDTIIVNELRFYEIANALQSMQLNYDKHGKWNSVINGRYQSNVPQLIWTNVKILNQNETFTVSACGTETMSEYFSGIMVLDENNRDCFSENHPNRDQLIAYFSSNMRNLKSESEFYEVYHSR